MAGAPVPQLRGQLLRLERHPNILAGGFNRGIRGQVTKGGVALPYARVWLFERTNPNPVALAHADAAGWYEFRHLVASNYGYVTIGFDDGGTYDPAARDLLQPEPLP